MAVLLELKRVGNAVLDPAAQLAERPGGGIADKGRDQLRHAPTGQQLIHHDVRGHPDDSETPAALTDDLVSRGGRDQVSEPLE